MVLFFAVLIILTCVILGFLVLIQNPKGGGLAGNIAGFSNQFMGVKQTTDVLEKGTWIFALIVALLCLFSAAFIPKTASNGPNLIQQINTSSRPANTLPPANTAPAPQAPAGKTK